MIILVSIRLCTTVSKMMQIESRRLTVVGGKWPAVAAIIPISRLTDGPQSRPYGSQSRPSLINRASKFSTKHVLNENCCSDPAMTLALAFVSPQLLCRGINL